MADVVLTVAKSLVEGTLTKAQLAIEEEKKLRKKAQRDLVFIAGEFQMMQSFLSVTTKENVQDNVVSTCVTQVRDLAYDVEDCIEFILHLDTRPGWWRRLVPLCVGPSPPLDEAVDILEHLKTRVQDLSERNQRYKLMRDNSSDRSVLGARQPSTAGASDKRQHDIDALTKMITKTGNDLQVMSVWASGADVGAASIVRDVFDSANNWGKFRYRAWVKLGKDFSAQEFIGSLMGKLHAKPHPDQQEDYLIKEFRKQLKNKPYLIVFEDACTTEKEWDTIKQCLPDCGNGSRVVVLTEQFQVARICVGSPYIQRFWCDYSHCVFSSEIRFIGRESEIRQLLADISGAPCDELNVISVWGIAGAGKSALVRNLYHNTMLRSKYEKFFWMDVSDSINLEKFCQSLLLQFHSHFPGANKAIYGKNTKIKDFIMDCKTRLRHQKCFIVIDNLQCTKDWDIILEVLGSISAGSYIFVTTSEERIALQCARKKGIIRNVKGLEFGPAIDLLKNQLLKNGNIRVQDIHNNVELTKLVSKCGGLPKVIVTVADYLGQKFEWEETARTLNDQLISNLETRSEFACLRGLFCWMQSYLETLPEDLKHHVAYLLIFPGYHRIRRRRLLMRWVAEGYSKDSDSYTANENGENVFSKLAELSMIHPPLFTTTADTRMVSYQISNIFHEYIVSRPAQENIAAAMEIFALRGTCSPTSRRRGRHLVIEESWDGDRIVYGNIDFSRLRSLTVFGKWDSFFITQTMRVLRVLDLEDASCVTDKDLQNILTWLTRLKFLSLRGCTDISYLPSSVGNLRQLQILDVRYTKIVTLPPSITKLRKLEYIRAGNSAPPQPPSVARTRAFKWLKPHRYSQVIGVEVFSGIGKLTSLHTLGVVNVGSAGGKVILTELTNLTQLRKLGVSGVSKKNGKEFCSAVLCHSRLESLSMWLDKDQKECLDSMTSVATNEISGPPKILQSLKLYGPVEKLPTWINMLNNLRKLNLEKVTLSEDDIRVLGNLPELCILRLLVESPKDGKVSFCVKTAGAEDFCYNKLKVIEISSRSKFGLMIGLLAMRNLKVLRAGCYTAGCLPHFATLKHLGKLKEVCVIGSHDDTLMKNLESQFADRKSKPSLKMEEVYPSSLGSTGGNGQTQESTGGNNKVKTTRRGNQKTNTTTRGKNQTEPSTGGNERQSSFPFLPTWSC